LHAKARASRGLATDWFAQPAQSRGARAIAQAPRKILQGGFLSVFNAA
jgi:hypothetical protein